MFVTILIVLIVLIDQISKYLANLRLNGAEAFSVIPGVLSFSYHENKGAAWGILANHRWVFMLLSTVAILLIIWYLIYTRKEKKPALLRLALCFFVGGGIGNMIDRIYLGYVIDFLRFDFIDFPIFNVADSFITVGAVLLILDLILETFADKKKKNG